MSVEASLLLSWCVVVGTEKSQGKIIMIITVKIII